MIAGFIFLRLRGILGKRTGFDGKAPPQFDKILKEAVAKQAPKQETFDENAQKEFLNGAKIAYETIITDFSDNDNKIIASKPLLSREIFNQFDEALKEYKKSIMIKPTRSAYYYLYKIEKKFSSDIIIISKLRSSIVIIVVASKCNHSFNFLI